KGIFPASYVCLKESDVDYRGTSYEVVIPKEDAIVKEMTSVLREWSAIWKQQYVENKLQLFVALRKIMWDMVEYRQQLLSGTLTQDQMDEIKEKAIHNIDWGNSKMGLDLVPRINGEMVDADSCSVVHLYQEEVASGTIKRAPKAKTKNVTTQHHIYFNMNSFMCNVEESCEVFFSLYNGKSSKFFSERFMVSIGKHFSNQKVNQLQKVSNSTCVFTDLGSVELRSTDTYLVAHLIRVGKMLPESKKVSSVSYRRPYGCAVLDIVDLLQGKEEIENSELFMPIQFTSETEFLTIHESIIKKLQSKNGLPESSTGIYVSMRLLHGELEKIQQENPLLFPEGIAVARKLGFPEIIMPGDVRNDVYVTIEKGEFEKSGKTTAKNVEVSMSVIGANGRLIEDCIYLGAGGKPCTEYESFIYYHNSSPKWNETVKVRIPSDKFVGSLLRFGFRHVSKFEEKHKELKTFAFSFVKLMGEDETTLPDGSHELCMYKFDSNSYFDSKAFINMPSLVSEVGNMKYSQMERLSRSSKDSFSVRTLVCSTKLTQNVDLVGVLKWRKQSNLQAVVNSLFKIDGEEIVKFLQDIFDALFSILNESVEEYGNLVFQAMVHVIWILSKQKYQHFQAVLNTYIEKHFSATIAYKYVTEVMEFLKSSTE
ncbi:predicted protein, partial [Nematostella vectensis]